MQGVALAHLNNFPSRFPQNSKEIYLSPPHPGVLLLLHNLFYLKILKIAFEFCRPHHQMLVFALRLKTAFLVPDHREGTPIGLDVSSFSHALAGFWSYLWTWVPRVTVRVCP